MLSALVKDGVIEDLAIGEVAGWMDVTGMDVAIGFRLMDGVFRPQLDSVSLSDAQAAKADEIRFMRDCAEESGFEYLGLKLDSDPVACKRLFGAALAAQTALAAGMAMADDVFVTWTCADRSLLELTYRDASLLPIALVAEANALHVLARQKIAAVYAAETIEAVAEISFQ